MIIFWIENQQLNTEADEIEQCGDFVLARQKGKIVAVVRLSECKAIWGDEIKRRRGSWGGQRECPLCGEDKFKGLDAEIWADWNPPFCPNCGARMDLGSIDSGERSGTQPQREDV